MQGKCGKVKIQGILLEIYQGKKEASEKDKAKEWVSSVKYRCKIWKTHKRDGYSFIYILNFKRCLNRNQKLSEGEYVKNYQEMGSNLRKLTKRQTRGRTIKWEINSFRFHLRNCGENVEKMQY